MCFFPTGWCCYEEIYFSGTVTSSSALKSKNTHSMTLTCGPGGISVLVCYLYVKQTFLLCCVVLGCFVQSDGEGNGISEHGEAIAIQI